MISDAIHDKISGTARDARFGLVAGAVLVLIASTLLLGYNLAGWPVTWYDEGTTLQVAKNLEELGRYGILSSDGFEPFSSIISTGPTVSVPIALVFAVWGLGLLQARIVMVAFALFSILGLYALTYRLFDVRTAIVGSFLFISVGAASGDVSASFVGLGRMVMGEIPALALFFAGTLLWSTAIESRKLISLAGAGLLWGLSIVTKPQFALLVVGFCFTWVVYVLARQRVSSRLFIIPLVVMLVCAGIWSAWQYLAADAVQWTEGPERIGTNLFFLSPRLILKGARVLLSQRELIWGLPALIYGVYITVSSRRVAQALPMLFLISFCVVWLLWFVLGSIGWGRYAFIPIAITTLFTAKLLVDLMGRINWTLLWSHADGFAAPALAATVRAIAVWIALILMIGGSLQSMVKEIVMTRDDSPSAFAAYLDRTLPPGTVIECFEPEIVFLSEGDFRFHQPTLSVLNLAIRHVQLGVPYPQPSDNLLESGATYLVDGPFSKQTHFYLQDFNELVTTQVASTGAYDLYQISTTERH